MFGYQDSWINGRKIDSGRRGCVGRVQGENPSSHGVLDPLLLEDVELDDEEEEELGEVGDEDSDDREEDDEAEDKDEEDTAEEEE